MVIEGYEGICRECFCPVSDGEGTRLRDGGMLFHKKCVDNPPNSGYYIKLERRRVKRIAARTQTVSA